MEKIIELSFVNSDNVKVEVSAFKEPNNYVSLLIDINGTMISSLVPDIAYNEKSVLKAAKKIEKGIDYLSFLHYYHFLIHNPITI